MIISLIGFNLTSSKNYASERQEDVKAQAKIKIPLDSEGDSVEDQLFI
jgi:hypothetical protein